CHGIRDVGVRGHVCTQIEKRADGPRLALTVREEVIYCGNEAGSDSLCYIGILLEVEGRIEIRDGASRFPRSVKHEMLVRRKPAGLDRCGNIRVLGKVVIGVE